MYHLKSYQMERVATLIEKLNNQLKAGVAADQLLLTVELLQAELNHELSLSGAASSLSSSIAIHITPGPLAIDQPANENVDKVSFTLDVDENELEAELEQIRKTAEAKNSISIKNKRPFYFDPVEDTPTLSHQKKSAPLELNDQLNTTANDTLNEKLKESRKELSEALKDTPIKDLKKAIGVNDRFLFINELFQGDEVMYERSIKTINAFSIYPEAEYWIRRELKTKLGWNEFNAVVKQFDQLVKRRFPSI